VQHFALLVGYGAAPSIPTSRSRRAAARPRRRAEGRRARTKPSRTTEGRQQGHPQGHDQDGDLDLQSYRGAQIFEAIGLNRELIEAYFTGTASRIEGIGLDAIAAESAARHDHAYSVLPELDGELDPGGQYQWRRRGEFHMYNPNSIALLQHAVRAGSYKLFKRYSEVVNDENRNLATLRGLLKFRPSKSIPLDAVEPASAIVKRFKTGAMSLGSISREAHETSRSR
jgi:glutamate synthase domain-containing protein 2